MDPFVRLTQSPLHLAPDTRLLKRDDYQAFLSAKELLAALQREAEARRTELAQEEARRLQAGYEQGLAQARQEMAARMLETVDRTVDYLAAIEHRVVDLVMMAVRKILGEFDDVELTARIVRQAMLLVRNQPQATIRVCPAQAEDLRARIDRLFAGHTGPSLVEVVPDPRLGRGDCILETEIGMVDASLETQLKALEQAMRTRLQRKAGATGGA